MGKANWRTGGYSARSGAEGKSASQCSALATCLLATCLLFSACAQMPTPTVEAVHLTLVADTSSAPLVDVLVEAYLAERPHATIGVERAANTARALQALQAGQFDLASVSWLPEVDRVGGTLWYRLFARDAIVMITHPTNPIGGLTLLQLRDIFEGQTLFWNDLGGLNLEVIPISREDGAGTRSSFESLVMGGSDVASTAVVMPSSETVAEHVSITPGAIGYVSSAWIVPGVNLLAVEGVAPSPASVADGRYLLARPFYLVARAEPTGALADFVNWLTGDEGQEVVKRHYAPAP